jgi:polyisoprenyl-phosphate glycosyltransferase
MQRAIILTPIYNDEASFRIFAAAIEKQAAALTGFELSFLVVNDGTDALRIQTTLPLTVLHLHRNIGHQKAIAIGLAYAHHQCSFDRIVVMDGDGEDAPEDLAPLLQHKDAANLITVARRASRQEGRSFRFFYLIYKWLFLILTGKRIAFGNFMSIPKKEVARLVHYNEIWNHLAGAIIKSRRPYAFLDTHRGRRYAGTSNMHFTGLLLHGLGAIGVFIEVIASRLLVFSFFMILISVASIGVIIYVKYFTDKAIPGWATTTVSSMLIVILQSFLLSLFTIFLYLTSQGQRKFIPAHHYNEFISAVETNNDVR